MVNWILVIKAESFWAFANKTNCYFILIFRELFVYHFSSHFFIKLFRQLQTWKIFFLYFFFFIINFFLFYFLRIFLQLFCFFCLLFFVSFFCFFKVILCYFIGTALAHIYFYFRQCFFIQLNCAGIIFLLTFDCCHCR